MSSKVFLVRTKRGESIDSLARKAVRLTKALDADLDFSDGQLVAIKQHFGEGKNTGFIRPPVARAFAKLIAKQGGKPFLGRGAGLHIGDPGGQHALRALGQRGDLAQCGL